jgi:hypothetical protein
MQIFVTDKDPKKSSINLWSNPIRARKMITESMQIMACALEYYKCTQQLKKTNGEPYATPKSRMNHPVVKWVCEDKVHLTWLCLHCSALYAEYKRRKGNAFANIPKNLEIVYGFAGNDYYQINFLNFAKCKSKNLDFTCFPVCEAYIKYLKLQEKK